MTDFTEQAREIGCKHNADQCGANNHSHACDELTAALRAAHKQGMDDAPADRQGGALARVVELPGRKPGAFRNSVYEEGSRKEILGILMEWWGWSDTTWATLADETPTESGE